MIKGQISARAVALQDLMSDLKVIDKKTISLGVLELDINEQTNRTLEEKIKQKRNSFVEENRENIETIPYQDSNVVEELSENEEEKKEEKIPGEDDKVI